MPSQRLRVIIAALLLSAVIAGCWAAPRTPRTDVARTRTVTPLRARHYTPRQIATLDDARIDEGSGLAASRRYPGYLWTHNDSGDRPRLFLISPAGKTVAVVNLENANAFDWEDMAIGGTGENAWVYAGDIGDNFRWRSDISIYRFREPELDVRRLNQTLHLRAERMVLKYSARQADAEALAATADGRLLIATKLGGASRLWRTPQPFADGTQQTLEPVGQYSFAQAGELVTGADLSPDGRRLALVTYRNLYEWIVPLSEGGAPQWNKVWQSTPQMSPLPAIGGVEAVCYSADGKKLFISREGIHAPLYAMEGAN